jgi:hypothetical protein
MRKASSIMLACVMLTVQVCMGQAASKGAGRYRMLQGTIDKYPVTMHLYDFNGQWMGSYSYDRVGQPMSFISMDTLKDGTVSLDVYRGDNSESFRMSPTADGLEGNWKKDPKSQPLRVSLKDVKPLVPMRLIHQSERVAHRPANPESPGCSFEATAVWPEGSTPTAEFVKRQVRASLDEKAAGSLAPEALIGNMKKKYIDDCKAEAKNAKEEELREMPSMYSRDIVHRVTVNHQSGDFLCLEDMEWEYSGGAHGNGYSTYRILDLKNQKRLGMKDLFTPNGIKALPKLIEKRFRIQYGLKPGQSLKDAGLFENRIEKATENVYLTAKGVVFSYTAYEIGPYAMGPIEIFVPYTELKPHLQPGFAKRVGA